MEFALLTAAGFLAGLIDTVVGGGDLVQIPALSSVYPNTTPVMLIDINKVVSMSGTATATVRYDRMVRIYWGATALAVVTAFVFSLPGAWAFTHIPAEPLCHALPFVLVVLLVYTVAKKNLGADHAPSLKGWRELVAASLVDATTDFYDGVFGPDTGSFLIVVLVRVFGYDFPHALASTKIANLATNVATLLLLAVKGHVWWQSGLVMAVANVAGSQVGSHLTPRHSSHFVCKVFTVVVLALILKTACDVSIRRVVSRMPRCAR